MSNITTLETLQVDQYFSEEGDAPGKRTDDHENSFSTGGNDTPVAETDDGTKTSTSKSKASNMGRLGARK